MIENRNLRLGCMILFLGAVLPFWSQHPIQVHMFNFSFLVVSIFLFLSNKKPFMVFKVFGVSLAMILSFTYWGQVRGLEPGLSLLVMLGALKLMEMDSSRDLMLFALITELILVGHLLTAENLAMTIYIYLLSCLLFFVLFFHEVLINRLEHFKIKLAIFRRIMYYSLPVGILLFFLFPRFQVGSFLFRNTKKISRTGMSEDLRPGNVSRLVLSNQPMFVADFKEKLVLPLNELYWRGKVLNYTNGFHWRTKKIDKIGELFYSDIQSEYYITHKEEGLNFIFHLGAFNRILSSSPLRHQPIGGGAYRVTPFNNSLPRYFVKYKGGKRRDTSLSKASEKNYLELPLDEIPQSIIELAESFDATKPEHSLRKFFASNGYRYSLSPGNLGKGSEGELLERFLLEAKVGFCEHFASAAAVLFRLMGVPSRVVIGFQGGSYNEYGDYFLIQGKDAHAWVEFYDELVGWKRFDPTNYVAPERVQLGATEYFNSYDDSIYSRDVRDGFFSSVSIFNEARKFMDNTYYQLNVFFLNYDRDGQKSFLEKFGIKGGRSVMIVILGFLLTILFMVFWFFVKNPIFKVQFKGRKAPAKKAWSKLLGKMEKLELEKQNFEGAMDYSTRVSGFLQSPKELEDLAKDYCKIVYGKSQEQTQIKMFIKKVDRFHPQKNS